MEVSIIGDCNLSLFPSLPLPSSLGGTGVSIVGDFVMGVVGVMDTKWTESDSRILVDAWECVESNSEILVDAWACVDEFELDACELLTIPGSDMTVL